MKPLYKRMNVSMAFLLATALPSAIFGQTATPLSTGSQEQMSQPQKIPGSWLEDDPNFRRLPPEEQEEIRQYLIREKLYEIIAQQERQKLQQPQPTKRSGELDSCLHGATNAFLITAVGTGAGCLIDLFLTGGALCVTTYIPIAASHVPAAAAAGCAVGGFINAGTAPIINSGIPKPQMPVNSNQGQ